MGHVSALLLAVLLMAQGAGSAHANDTASGGDFVPLTSAVKVFESATGTGGAAAAGVGAAKTVDFPVVGVGAVPAEGVSAVLIQVTALAPTAAVYVNLWASGQSRPGTSVLNLPAGSTGLSTTVPIPVGADGTVSLYNSAGTTKYLATVVGYYLDEPSQSATGFVPTATTGIVDTRSGLNVTKAKIAAKASVTVKVTGAVVPTGARSVFVDAIVVGATAAGTVSNASSSKFSYTTGTTSSPMLVVPNSAGQVTLTNGGTAAIDLVLSADGYSAATTTTGSGLRVVRPARVASSLNVAAGATVEVQVAGAGGLPLRGIKAVPLSVGVSTATAAGYVRIWPSTASEPAASAMNFTTEARASATTTSLGTTGAIKIHNISSATAIRMYVDVLGLYGAPPGTVAPIDGAATALVQMPGTDGDPGPVEYAYTDGTGQLFHGYQPDPADFRNVQWTADPDQEIYSGAPSLTSIANGTVLTAVRHHDADIYAIRSPTGPDWSGSFNDLGGSMSASPAVGSLPDGTGIVFAVDVDGSLWSYSYGVTPLYWRRLSTAALTGTPTVSRLADGLQLAVATSSGTVKTATFKNGVLSAWVDLGGSGVTERPAVVIDASGKVRVLVRQADGHVVSKMQAADGTFPGAWSQVGGLVTTGAPSAALSGDGALVVFSRNTDGYVYETDETSARSGTWSEWLPIANQAEPAATDVSVTAITGSPDGWTWLGVYRTRDNSTRVVVPKPMGQALATVAASPHIDEKSVGNGSRRGPDRLTTFAAPSPTPQHTRR